MFTSRPSMLTLLLLPTLLVRLPELLALRLPELLAPRLPPETEDCAVRPPWLPARALPPPPPPPRDAEPPPPPPRRCACASSTHITKEQPTTSTPARKGLVRILRMLICLL